MAKCTNIHDTQITTTQNTIPPSKYVMAKIQLAKLKYYPKLWMTEIHLGLDQEF